MFWSKLMCKSNWISAFPVFISPVVWNMCENLHFESVYFKQLHNDQEYYWPTIYIARESVMAARREVNRIVPADIGLRESSSLEHAAIYDHLSPRLQSLLSDAKKIKERFLFSFCWAKNSTIWLRKNETSRPIAIKNSTDLSSLTARLGSSGDVTTP